MACAKCFCIPCTELGSLFDLCLIFVCLIYNNNNPAPADSGHKAAMQDCMCVVKRVLLYFVTIVQ